jgi:hypothetical protein
MPLNPHQAVSAASPVGSLAIDFAHALDPVSFAEDRLGFKPDPWQAQLLRSPAKQIILNCCRQSGKSTTTSILALHVALYEPTSLTLLISPSQRQSKELFAKVIVFLRTLEPAEVLEEDNRLSCTLANGSRIVSLPGDQKTIRGYSGPTLIIEDEAARVLDETYAAIRPMLAVSGGRLVLMSTPAGRRGHFHDTWHGAAYGWERISIAASECPRIGQEFLDEEQEVLGPLLYAQEYECRFEDTETSAFMSDLINVAFVDTFAPFIPIEATA